VLAVLGAIIQVWVVVLHQALLQLLSVPAGRLQWLLWVHATQVPVELQNPGASPAVLPGRTGGC